MTHPIQNEARIFFVQLFTTKVLEETLLAALDLPCKCHLQVSIGSLDVIPIYQDNVSKFLLCSLSQLPLLVYPIFALELRHEFPVKPSSSLDRPACSPDYQDGPLASKLLLSDILLDPASMKR